MNRKQGRHGRKPINLSRGAFAQLAAALGLAMLSQVARADWTLEDASNTTYKNVTINTWTPAEGLSINDSGGKLINIPTRNVLRLNSGQPVKPDPGSFGWRLALLNGDVLYGDPQSISGKSLVFHTTDLGNLAVPLKRVAMLSCPVYGPASVGDRSRNIPAAPDHDQVIFRETGDKLEGLIVGIDDTNLQLAAQGSDQPTPIALKKVDTIVFGGARPPRAIPPLSVRLAFTSGSVYTVALEGRDNPFGWQIGKVTVKDAAGTDHQADSDRIVSAEMIGGRVVYLTEMDFAKEEQTNFLASDWPAQVNKNVLGQPLKVAQTTYDHGIGVHTQSTLVYQLDGSFDTLAFRVGLDDSAAPFGEARASVVLDGKTIWPPAGAQVLKPGQISDEVALPIKGGKRLELHADSTDRLDVQGRVDWVNIALRRQ